MKDVRGRSKILGFVRGRLSVLPTGILCVILGMPSANAGESVELKVAGTIAVGPCLPTLSPPVVDFGRIPLSTLSANAVTTLPKKNVSFSVLCEAATLVAMKPIDNRSSSVVAGLNPAGGDGVSNFGLGVVRGKNVGNYNLRFSDAVVDGAPALRALVSFDAGTTWLDYVGVVYISALHAFASNGNRPTPMKTITMDVAVVAGIDKLTNLSSTADIPLDGSMTIELVYL